MISKRFIPVIYIFICIIVGACSKANDSAPELIINSPDGKISCCFNSNYNGIVYTLSYNGNELFKSENISISIFKGQVVGRNANFTNIRRNSVDTIISSPFYRANEIRDNYNGLTFDIDEKWGMAVRVYDDGFAYRWIYYGTDTIKIANEGLTYQFPDYAHATVPYVRDNAGNIQNQYMNSFENTYIHTELEDLDRFRLIFLPIVVECKSGIKVGLTESAPEDYPGLYLKGCRKGKLTGVFAPYPRKEQQGGHNNLQMIVTEREDFIARLDGGRSLPWRIVVVAPEDLVLAETNLSYLLGEPNRLPDIDWIKPGKVAWEWWNDWNLKGVDFITGVNNETYKAYIDFASRNGIEYVILDEGWTTEGKADLMQVVPEIDIKELVDYGNEKGVGIILWAGYYAFARNMEEICRHYSNLGIKGFKVDFMDRDDQKMTAFHYEAAAIAAKYGLVLDLHGTHKPAGLNRTFPNVLNFEGVNGMEQLKWAPDTLDMMKYDVQIPFIRQMAGPMDYTPGAMNNSTRENYRPSGSEPMGQGTRTHQLALYIVFDAPLVMLCDSPSNYEKEQESTDLIVEMPTIWDETKILDGKLGEYIITARRKGEKWWIGTITDWTPREIEIDFSSFLGNGMFDAVIVEDGVNAHRLPSDYRVRKENVSTNSKLRFHLAPGGGVVLKLEPNN